MTAVAALVAGLTTSLHCVGMCGPLACSVTSKARNRDTALIETSSYHAGRVFSYTLIGTLAGLVGKQPLAYFFDSPAAILPWFLVPFLIISCFPGLLNKLKAPKLNFLTKLYHRGRYAALKSKPGVSGGLMGLISPFLPCTPLYLIFGVCLLSGSWVTGAKLALCFSLGTIPLLWVVQGSAHRFIKHIPTRWKAPLRITLLVVVTAMLFTRMHNPFSSAEAAETPQVATTEVQQPSKNETATTKSAEPLSDEQAKIEATLKGLPSCCAAAERRRLEQEKRAAKE